MNRWFAGALAICASGLSCGVRAEQAFEMLADEEWRGAATHFGAQMPFDRRTSLEIDLRANNYYNQFSSLLLSNRGRVLWCDVQAKFSFAGGVIRVESEKPAVMTDAGKTLRDAFRFASKTYFPPSGKTPDLAFFAAPQYNTWIELTYNQNEKDILAYAQSMLDNGCPPGVLMIDDTWQRAYGDWNFEASRFTDPKGMVKKLHDQGFKVILWMCPWVSMDSPAYRLLTTGVDPFKVERFPVGGLYRNAKGVVPVEWWNGVSAMLDFTDPRGEACACRAFGGWSLAQYRKWVGILTGTKATEEDRLRYSPTRQIAPGLPPHLISYSCIAGADHDGIVPVSMYTSLTNALRRCGVPFTARLFPGTHHCETMLPPATEARTWYLGELRKLR